jgi:hypothetical protein
MSSAFCSLEDAFNGPEIPGKKDKKSKKKEYVVPGIPEDKESTPDPMGHPPAASSRPEPAASGDFFPVSGDWSKGFTLEGSGMPLQRPDGVAVAGKPTLWRDVPTPVQANQNDINRRLDALSRQLEALTTNVAATPMQSTAELFLFVAIGLLFILALDTLLRCATSVAVARGGYRGSGGSIARGAARSIMGRRWFRSG